MNHVFTTASVLLWLAHLVLAQPALAIVTSDVHGSHVVTPGQPSFGLNLDGVVIVGLLLESDDPRRYCTGALISDRQVLTAAHCFDLDGTGQIDPLYLEPNRNEMVFELTEGWVAIEYEVNSIVWPEAWLDSGGLEADLAVLTLIEDAPNGVPRYPLYGPQDEISQPFVMAGYGAPGYGATGVCCGDLAKRASIRACRRFESSSWTPRMEQQYSCRSRPQECLPFVDGLSCALR